MTAYRFDRKIHWFQEALAVIKKRDVDVSNQSGNEAGKLLETYIDQWGYSDLIGSYPETYASLRGIVTNRGKQK